MPFNVPTYRDELLRQQDSGSVVDLNSPVRCSGVINHRCNRLEDPFMMDDVRTVTGSLVGASQFICHACREWLFGMELIARPDYLEALGMDANEANEYDRRQRENLYTTGRRHD